MPDIDPNAVAPVVPIQTPQPVVPVVQAPAPTPAPTPEPITPKPATVAQAYNLGSGDAVIDVAVASYTKAFGVSGDLFTTAVLPAIESGDLSKLNTVALTQGAGAEAALFATNLVNSLAGHVRSKTDSVVAQVHAVAGNKENWVAAVNHLNGTQPDYVKDQFSQHLQSGDPERVKYAASEIVRIAQQAGVVQAILPIQPGSGVPGQAVALSAQEFAAKYADLSKRAGNRSLESGPLAAELQTLMAQRQAGIQAGR